MATLNLFGHKYFCKCNSWIRYRSFVLRRYHAVNINKNVHCNGGTFWLNHQKANRFTKNRFSDKPDEQRTVSFIISRGPFGWISNKLKLFLVNSYFDAQFEEEAFLEGAKQAVITVSALISERKFSQLQGLLTNEAIENLKDEMKFVNNIESYRITTDDILQVKIHDIGFQYDDSEKGKKWLHVMVTYICQGEHKYQKEVANVTFIRIPLPRVTKFSFCKECTSGVDDDWIITQVTNLKKETV